jgi:hypothetical protein
MAKKQEHWRATNPVKQLEALEPYKSSNMSIRKAAAMYGISKSALFNLVTQKVLLGRELVHP